MVDSKMRSMAPGQRNEQQQPSVTVQSFGAKFQTKNAIYQFLTVEVGAYLPAKSCVTVYFLRDLCQGKRKCKCPHHQSSLM